MSPVDLHALPAGSVVVDSELEAIAVRWDGVATRPWLVVGPNSTGAWFNAGHLLAMSQDWTVLRHGPTVADEHTGDDPEVRHYIAEIDEMRAHMTMTSREDDGRITTNRHPWEPLTDVNGATWYRVSDGVAAEYDWDPDDEDPRDQVDIVRGMRRVDPIDLDAP